jgi:hypothetical protein
MDGGKLEVSNFQGQVVNVWYSTCLYTGLGLVKMCLLVRENFEVG